MFKFFKKKTENKPQKKEHSKKEYSFIPPAVDTSSIFDRHVQRTLKDLTIVQTNIHGKNVSIALDSFSGASDIKKLEGAYGYNSDILGTEKIMQYYESQSFIGFQMCAILSQNWLINKCCALPPKEATAVEYDINLPEGCEVEDPKKFLAELKELSSDFGKYKINEVCRIFAENKRTFGQALCIPIVEGADMGKPFNIDGIKHGAYKGMSVIEPSWVTAVLDVEAITNPKSLRYYKPTYFRLTNGELIHYSWFIFNTYSDVKDILKPTYYFGGLPLPQLLYEAVYAAQKTGNEAPMLAMSKRLNYIECNTNAYLLNQDKMQKELALISWLRNNFGFLAIKKDQNIGQLDTTLTDFDSVVMLQYQICAAISGIQAVKLLETSPKGWQSSGSIEQANYKALLQSIQNEDCLPILDLHYKLLAKSEFDIDVDLKCVYGEIDTPTEKERAEIRELNSRTDMNYINAGVVSPEEIRDVLREDENSGYNTLSEEMEGEPVENDPFGNLMGGGENSTNFFNGDEWEENKHPRKENGQFGKGGSGKVEKSKRSDKIRKRTRKEVQLPKDEYARVMSELNSNLSKEERNKKHLMKAIGNYLYIVENNGFNNYRIVGKTEI